MPDPVDNVASNTLGTSAWANSVADTVNEMIGDLYAGVTLAIPYASLTGLPATFPPAAHDHAAGGTGNVPYANVSGKPATFPPSAHASSHAAGAADVVTPAAIRATSGYATPATAETFRIYRGTSTPTGMSEGDVWIKG